MTSPVPAVPPQAITAAAIDPAEVALHAYLGPWLPAEVHGTALSTQIRTAARLALEAAAPHLATTEPYSFPALLDAINAIAAKSPIPLDLAADLMRAIDSYGTNRAAEAVAAERERCAPLFAFTGWWHRTRSVTPTERDT